MLHEDAIKHVTGEAIYVNDMIIGDNLLHGRVVYSPYAYAKIVNYDLTAAQDHAGVHAVLSYKDIPGENQMGPVVKDESCLAEESVTCIGQAVFLIAAETKEAAREAEKLIYIEYEPLEPILELEDSIKKNHLLAPPRKIKCGDFEKVFKECPHKIEGQLKTGAQEHWYLETQTSLSVPGEEREMKVFSSSQHPSETQAIISEVLGINKNEVEVEVRRIGGAFGGKETQANHIAAWSSLLAYATGKPVLIHLFRDEDQIMTGKRHRFLSNWQAGFDNNGIIHALNLELNGDAGTAYDLSMAILERALFHVDNAYFIPNLTVVGKMWKTDHPSNTAFRGFGGPQGMAVIETVIDNIARYLEEDPNIIRYRNFYGINDRNITHYGEKVENNRLFKIYDQLITSSEYEQRRSEINAFNSKNEFYKKGLAITPVKFGISFTTSFLNQAAALINIYKDGSVLVNHGGVEMGQGLDTKIHGIVANELGIDEDWIKISPTNTSKVPNTSATAASSGSDLNGMAVKNGIEKLKLRLAKVFVKEIHGVTEGKNIVEENIVFSGNRIYDKGNPDQSISFKELVSKAYFNQVSLSATGFYKIPGIHWDKDKGKGHPFFYYSFGMAVSEVVLDVLTGYHKILRTDILHDVGDSLNEQIDRGQIEGGFIQGVGWCTTEDIKWDKQGRLLNHSPDTYKIPTIQDIPEDFRVELLKGAPHPITIRKSKAVGEPPLMLAFSVWLAIKDCISAVGNHKFEPEFSLPATNEVILKSIEKIKIQIAGS